MYNQMLYMGIVPNNLIFPWMMKCLLEIESLGNLEYNGCRVFVKFGIWNEVEFVWKDE
jgi:hypothetical protein